MNRLIMRKTLENLSFNNSFLFISGLSHCKIAQIWRDTKYPLMGIFHQKRIQKLEEMAENPLLKSLSSFMRRPYGREFITILKKK